MDSISFSDTAIVSCAGGSLKGVESDRDAV